MAIKLILIEAENNEEIAAGENCDGCDKEAVAGEQWITGIKSCCGGGCARSLCPDCIKLAFSLIKT